MGRSDPPHRMHSRISDGGVCGLPLHRVLWNFAVRSNRPFEIPIPEPRRMASDGRNRRRTDHWKDDVFRDHNEYMVLPIPIHNPDHNGINPMLVEQLVIF